VLLRDDPSVRLPAGWAPSHRALLEAVGPAEASGGSVPLQAVVVPSSRGADRPRSGLTFAARIARENSCPLVLLHSQHASAVLDDTLQSLTSWTSGEVDVVAIDAIEWLERSARSSRDTTFEVDRLQISRIAGPGFSRGAHPVRHNDVGTKRNLALLMARRMGWERVLFLDDDIQASGTPGTRTLDRNQLTAALDELGRRPVVAWTARDYADNSVVCRIRSMLGHPDQEQFVSGSALLVAVDERMPFFPAVYNEDWLFLLGYLDAQAHPVIGEAGDVSQDRYDGLHADRALGEELGDVLAEGLMSLRHGNGDAGPAQDPDYWRGCLRARRALIEKLAAEYSSAPGLDDGERRAIDEALSALQVMHAEVSRIEEDVARELAVYRATWLRDLEVWSSRLQAAGDWSLELDGCTRVCGPSRSVSAFLQHHRG